MSDLKPCPFCGGTLETRIDSTFNIHYAVHVPDNVDCPLSNDEYLWANPLMRDMNKEDLINKLNTRIIEDALQKRIDELEEELDCMHKRFRKPTHGSCCTCQRCGQFYDDCRCSLDDAADEIVELRTKIADLEKQLASYKKFCSAIMREE